MKKFLTFFASLFSLTLLLVALFGQPINVNADGEAMVSLNFTEEDGNFSVFSGDSYSTTKNVKVEISGKQDESAVVEISFNANELVVTGVDGVKSDEFSTPEKGLLRVITTSNEFTISFKIADESLDVYGVPFVGKVAKLQVGNTKYLSDEMFYFSRGYYGDLNLDGTINLLDYAYLRTILLGNNVTIDGKVVDVKKLADINHDGYVDFNDYNDLSKNIKDKEEDNNLESKTFSNKVYCTVTYVEEGKESYNKAYPFGEKVNGEIVTGDVSIKVEDVVNEYKVVYFFSTAANATPIVDYANAGEELELIVPNGTGLVNGYIRWYSYELNSVTGTYEMVPITDGYVMPNKDLYLYAQYYEQYFPLLVYKLNDSVFTREDLQYNFFDIVTKDEVEANGAGYLTSELLEGYSFGGWFFDEECTKSVEDFQILGDTNIYAKLDPKSFNVTFVKQNGDVNTVNEVKYNESISELEVVKPGYLFLGWYEDNATEPFDFENVKMPARDIVLTAKWADVVKDAATKLNDYLAQNEADNLVKVEFNSNLDEVNELTLVLNVEEIMNYADNSNADALNNLLAKVAEYCGNVYTEDVVSTLTLNGYQIYSDGKLSVKGLQYALTDLTDKFLESAKFVLNGNRVVIVDFKLAGGQESLDRFNVIIDNLDQYIDLNYELTDDKVVVDVLMPEVLIEGFENYNDADGVLTFKDFLLVLQEVYNQNLDSEQEKMIDKFVKLFIEQISSTNLVANSSKKLTIAGYVVKLESNANSVAELLAELVSDDSQLGDLLNVDLSTLFNADGAIEIPMIFELNLSNSSCFDTADGTVEFLVRLSWSNNPITIKFEANGADKLEVNGVAQDEVSGILGSKFYTVAEKEGYIFGGWYDNPGFIGSPVSRVDENGVYVTIPYQSKTYYAKWSLDSYNIYYAEQRDSSDVKETSQEYLTNINLKDIYDLNSFDLEKEGYTIVGWYWVNYADKDDSNVVPTLVDNSDSFVLENNILVWPVYVDQVGTITFDANNGTAEFVEKEVKLGEEYGTLPNATRRGYKFVGWFLEDLQVTSETIYEEKELAVSSYYQAKDVTLVAKWEVIDVAANGVGTAEEILEDVFNSQNGVEFPVKFETETDEFINLDGENVQLVNKIAVKVNVDLIRNFRNYQVESEYLSKTDLVENLRNIIAKILKDEEMINTLQINDYLVYENGKVQNDGVILLAQELVNSLVDDFAKGNNPTLNVLIDDAVCTRNVEVSLILEGSQERLNKIKEIASQVQNYTEFEFDGVGDAEITVIIPNRIVKKVEDKIYEDYQGMSIEVALNNITFVDALDYFIDAAEDSFVEELGILNRIASLIYNNKHLINKACNDDRYNIVVDDGYNKVKLFVENAEYNPASDSFIDVVSALRDVINPKLLATSLSTFNTDKGVYSLPLFLSVDLSQIDKLAEDTLEIKASVNFELNSSEYEVELKSNGGEFENGEIVEYVTGLIGDLIVVEPIKPGYNFVGWNEKEDGTGNTYSSIPNKDITLYAQWEARKYIFDYVVNEDGFDGSFDLDYYNPNGALETELDVTTVSVDGYDVEGTFNMAIPKSVNGYYVFAGWKYSYIDVNSTLVEGILTEVVNGEVKFVDNAEDIIKDALANLDVQDEIFTLTAMWENAPFNVTIYSIDGNQLKIFKNNLYKSEIVIDNLDFKSIKPAVKGKELVGWEWKFTDADDATYQTVDSTPITVIGNISVRPVYEIKTITIILNPDGGDVSSEKLYVKYDSTFEKLATAKDGEFNTKLSDYTPTKDGYMFKGWAYQGSMIEDITEVNGDRFDVNSITLDAVWYDYRVTIVYKGNETEYVNNTYGSSFNFVDECGPLFNQAINDGAVTAKVFTYDESHTEVPYQKEPGVDLVLDLVINNPNDSANENYYTIIIYDDVIVRFYDINGDLI